MGGVVAARPPKWPNWVNSAPTHFVGASVFCPQNQRCVLQCGFAVVASRYLQREFGKKFCAVRHCLRCGTVVELPCVGRVGRKLSLDKCRGLFFGPRPENSSGSLAKFAATRRASSFVSSLAANLASSHRLSLRTTPTASVITAGICARRNGVRWSFCVATILKTECPLSVKSRHRRV